MKRATNLKPIDVHPYSYVGNYAYIRDLAFKSYVDLFYSYDIIDYQYEEKNGQVVFVYNIEPEALQDIGIEWANSKFLEFKMHEDKNRNLVHNIIQPMKPKKN